MEMVWQMHLSILVWTRGDRRLCGCIMTQSELLLYTRVGDGDTRACVHACDYVAGEFSLRARARFPQDVRSWPSSSAVAVVLAYVRARHVRRVAPTAQH